jgi:SAM-dependent methyltransferase
VSDSLTYNPEIFHVGSLEEAKAVILNPDQIHSTDERWIIETDWILDLLKRHMPGDERRACLDYGCGIGRLAKPLIRQRDWVVIGADISNSMRSLATAYVDSPHFLSVSHFFLDPIRVDCALAVWTLQHCKDVKTDIAQIKRSLWPSGRLFVLNALERFVPTHEETWSNDGVDVWEILQNEFRTLQLCDVDQEIIPTPPAKWGVFARA